MRAGCLMALGVAVLLASSACGSAEPRDGQKQTISAPARGGELVVAVRTEPKSFSWYTQHDATTQDVTFLTQARLVRVNRVTQDIEPWLAESWTRSRRRTRYTLKLRPNVTFADGHPFTADDVAVFVRGGVRPEGRQPADGRHMTVGGKPLAVAAPDPLDRRHHLPGHFAPGLRILDNLPILPQAQARGGAARPARSRDAGACPRRSQRSPASVRSC